MYYTVEVTTEPVLEGDWSLHLRAVDAVPGTFLVQDAEEPMLVFPVESDDAMKAAQFVAGVADLLDIQIVKGSTMPAPEIETDLFEDDDDEDAAGETPVVARVNRWLDETPDIKNGLVSA